MKCCIIILEVISLNFFKNKYFTFFFSIVFVFVLSFDTASFLQKQSGLALFRFPILWMGLLAFLFYFFFRKSSDEKLSCLQVIFAIFLSAFMIIGYSFEKVGSLQLLFDSWLLFFLSLFQGIAYYFLFSCGLKLFNYYLFSLKPFRKVPKCFQKIATSFQRHPFLFSFLFLLASWAIYMLAFYPLILSRDPSFQIKQYFNVPTKYMDYVVLLDPKVRLTNHHPVFHTILLGGFIEIGRFFGSDNVGLFLYALLQSVTLASAFASLICFLYQKKIPVIYCLVILFLYAFVPVFPFYAMSAVKDTFYTAFILFYVLLLLKGMDKKVSISPLYLCCMFFTGLFLFLFRNNGIYVFVLSFPAFIIYKRKEWLRLLLVFLLLIGSYGFYDKVLLPSFHITPGSKREALSVVFQQSARYVKEHGDLVTASEKAAIDKVLGYDDLAQRYNPVLADPVKNKFNKYATSFDLQSYFKVWYRQFFKAPMTYIEATLHNTFGYFYPDTTNWYIYYRYNKLITEDHLVNYHYNHLSFLRSILQGYGVIFPYIPVLGLLVNIGFNAWILLFSIVYLLTYHKGRYLICFLPFYISYLICFVSPANTYFRYAMPFVFGMPILFTFIVYVCRERESIER